MKTILGIFLITITSQFAFSQDFSKYDNHAFTKKEDYKSFEPVIVEMSNYILSHKVEDGSANQKIALKVLIIWMSGTPDYQFSIDESFSPFMDKNKDLVGIFMASLANFALKHADQTSNAKQFKKGAYETFLDYCAKEEFGVKKFKELNKALTARNDGTLDTYLKLQ